MTSPRVVLVADDSAFSQAVQHQLREQAGHAAMAAELGISIRKLYYRISQYQKKGII